MVRKRPLGCLTIPGLIAGVLVILVIIGIGVFYGGKMFSPGELNALPGALIGEVTSHAATAGKCSSCHAFFWQKTTMNDRCLACHTDVAEQLNDPKSLHGDQLNKQPGLDCRDCHPDHRGANASLIDLSMIDASHDNFGFALTAHQKQSDGTEFTCRTCHVSGYTTFDQTVCITCHQQMDAAFMPAHLQVYSKDCLACHDGIDTYGSDFSHDTAPFKLTGKHVQVDCIGCHEQARDLTELKSTPQDCYSCHAKDDAHEGELGFVCGRCHTTAGWIPATFNHAQSKFPLTGAHADLDCAICHLNNKFIAIQTDCYSCHAKDDPHNGQFGTICAACHDTAAWLPATFDHEKSNFPLTGAHAHLVCTECHDKNIFTPLDSTCISCHAQDDAHNGKFSTFCDACHTTTAWQPPTFDHATSKFPLTGAHASLECAQCHPNNIFTPLDSSCYSCHEKDDQHNGQFGTVCDKCHSTTAWLPASFDHTTTGFVLNGAHTNLACSQCHPNNIFTHIDTSCYSCHAKDDTHKGQFGQACNQCHSTSAWLPASFDHTKTGFNLTGAHTNLACSQCHPNNVFNPLDTACYACHAKDDAHNGQFGQDCGQCHSTTAWKPASFDHSKTGFPLTGAHSKLACGNCHANGNFGGLSPACYSCHAKDDAHGGQFGQDCGSCHSTNAWKPASFDHSKTGFPLTGGHAGLACGNCHNDGNFGGLSPVCSTCHSDPAFHAGLFGNMTCDQCHNTTAWVPAQFNAPHPNACGEVTCINHEGATCRDCHTVDLMDASCLKCHDSNDPGDGGGGR